MRSDKIRKFMKLGGQKVAENLQFGNEEQRKLGAQLLLSEVLEYVIHGLGVVPVVNGTEITEPDNLQYKAVNDPDALAMLDGLSDVAYTMYWNSEAFGLPLEDAFEAVCDNNLEKFVSLNEPIKSVGRLDRSEWHCNSEISWPSAVERVEVVDVEGEFYAVGKDENGKVRKPSSYSPVDLTKFVSK